MNKEEEKTLAMALWVNRAAKYLPRPVMMLAECQDYSISGFVGDDVYHLKYDELPMFSLLRLGLQRDEPHQLRSVSCGHGEPAFFAALTMVRLRNFSPRPHDLLQDDQSFHSETMQSGDSYSGMILLVIFRASSGRLVAGRRFV